MGSENTSCLDVSSFLAFQEVYRTKVVALFRHIWHRGAVLSIKKFKYLKLRES